MLKWLLLLRSPWRERETRWVVRTSVAWLSFIKAAYTQKEAALFCAACDISTLSWFTIIGQIIWVKKCIFASDINQTFSIFMLVRLFDSIVPLSENVSLAFP